MSGLNKYVKQETKKQYFNSGNRKLNLISYYLKINELEN